jgi:hypothetical protein
MVENLTLIQENECIHESWDVASTKHGPNCCWLGHSFHINHLLSLLTQCAARIALSATLLPPFSRPCLCKAKHGWPNPTYPGLASLPNYSE